MLAPAGRLWQEAASKFDPARAVALEAEVDPPRSEVAAGSLTNSSKWLDHAITKLGACAAVADEKEMRGLEPPAAEVITAFMAALGTLISLRQGAGACLCSELRKAGQDLASTLEQFGASIGKPSMALAAGKALECAQRLEHVPTHNRPAIEKRLQAIIAQLRDGHVDLKAALSRDDDEDSGLCDEDDVFDEALDPDEACVAEAASAAILLVEGELVKAVKSCGARAREDAVDLISVEVLEVFTYQSALAVDAIDGLIAHLVGGLDREEFAQSLETLQEAVTSLGGIGEMSGVENLEVALKDVRTALAKACND